MQRCRETLAMLVKMESLGAALRTMGCCPMVLTAECA